MKPSLQKTRFLKSVRFKAMCGSKQLSLRYLVLVFNQFLIFQLQCFVSNYLFFQTIFSKKVVTAGEKAECFYKCIERRNSITVTACEARGGPDGKIGCFAHTNMVSKGLSTDSNNSCWVMSKCTPKLSEGNVSYFNVLLQQICSYFLLVYLQDIQSK